MKHLTIYKVSGLFADKSGWRKLREFTSEKQARDFAKTIRNKMNMDTSLEKTTWCNIHKAYEDITLYTYYSKERKFLNV